MGRKARGRQARDRRDGRGRAPGGHARARCDRGRHRRRAPRRRRARLARATARPRPGSRDRRRGESMKIWAFLIRDWRSWGSYRFSVLLQMAGMMFVLMVFFFISTAVELRERSSVELYADNYFDF